MNLLILSLSLLCLCLSFTVHWHILICSYCSLVNGRNDNFVLFFTVRDSRSEL